MTIRSNCLIFLAGAATTILTSLVLETRYFNSFWQPLTYASTSNATNNKNNLEKIQTNIKSQYKGTQNQSSSEFDRIHIQSNSNSTIGSDIYDIWHDLEHQAICVSLQEQARCPHPSFVGRLSGPSLALLEWNEESNGDSSEFVHCGSYERQWLEAGTYYLEIIILFCNDFGINAISRTQNESAWLSYDFQKDCIEPPAFNRITGEGSYLTIEETIQNTPHLRHRGRWVAPGASKPEPLHTRYQPKHCRRNPQIDRCAVPMNDTALKSYTFEWENRTAAAWNERLKIAARTFRNKMPKICLVGYSHSRFLAKSFGAIGLGNIVQHVQARYPSDVSPWLFDHYYTNHSCTRFVVGVAQWPGSLMQGAPYLFDRFYSEMKRIAKDAATTFADKEDDVKVYLRSVHQIPIGDATGFCPITDWRSPVVMDGYTHVIQKAVSEVKQENLNGSNHVEFLDTRFIVSPMWDNAFDWIHLPPQVSDVEALYMAAIIYEHFLNDPTTEGIAENGFKAV